MDTTTIIPRALGRVRHLVAVVTRSLHVQADLQARYVYDLGASGRQARATIPVQAVDDQLEHLFAMRTSPTRRRPAPTPDRPLDHLHLTAIADPTRLG